MSSLINIKRSTKDSIVLRTRNGVTESYKELELTDAQLEDLVFELAQWFKLKQSWGEPVRFAHLWLNTQANQKANTSNPLHPNFVNPNISK